MKIDKKILIPAGIAIVGLGIYFFTRPKNEEQVFEQLPLNTGGTTTNTTTTQPVIIDKNKLLKRGVNGLETKKLQELLGFVYPDNDGIFGPKTEGALLAKKGVIQTTLNQFATLPNVNQNPIAIGSRVMVNLREGLNTRLATKLADGSFAQSNEFYRVFSFGEELGTIVSMTASKNYYVIKRQQILGSDIYLFVEAASVKKI